MTGIDVRAAPAVSSPEPFASPPRIPAMWRFAVARSIDWPPRRSLLARLLSML